MGDAEGLFRRIRRRWVHPAPMALTAAAVLGLFLADLVLEDAGPRPERAQSPTVAGVPARTRIDPARQREIANRVVSPRARSAHSALDVQGTSDVAVLASWCLDRDLPPMTRYQALGRLESVSAESALPVAIKLSQDPTGLVRTRAIAALSVNGSPPAKEALGKLEGGAASMAAKLAPRSAR